jgi:hypothetical protein
MAASACLLLPAILISRYPVPVSHGGATGAWSLDLEICLINWSVFLGETGARGFLRLDRFWKPWDSDGGPPAATARA